MKRTVGKYTIWCTEEEINVTNYFKHNFKIETENSSPVLIHAEELFLEFAINLRYSKDENQITETLKNIIRQRENGINELKQLCSK